MGEVRRKVLANGRESFVCGATAAAKTRHSLVERSVVLKVKLNREVDVNVGKSLIKLCLPL